MPRIARILAATLVAYLISSSVFAVPGGTAASPSKAKAIESIHQATALLDSWRGQGAVLEQAKNKLDLALSQDPGSAWAYREYARYFIMRGDIIDEQVSPEYLAQADQALQKAIQLRPNFAEAYVLGGHLYRLMGRTEEAKAALKKAEALGTDDPWLQNNWADILVDEGKFNEAAKRYSAVVNRRGKNTKATGRAMEGLIHCYRGMGQIDDADHAYRQAIAFEPTSAWSYGNYAAFLLCTRDEYESSIVQARKALSLMDYGVGRAVLASALYRKWAAQIESGQRADAANTFAEGQSLDPNHPVAAIASMCGEGKALSAVLRAANAANAVKM